MKKYFLTDGDAIYDMATMTPEQAQDANREAERATDGTFWWASE